MGKFFEQNNNSLIIAVCNKFMPKCTEFLTNIVLYISNKFQYFSNTHYLNRLTVVFIIVVVVVIIETENLHLLCQLVSQYTIFIGISEKKKNIVHLHTSIYFTLVVISHKTFGHNAHSSEDLLLKHLSGKKYVQHIISRFPIPN